LSAVGLDYGSWRQVPDLAGVRQVNDVHRVFAGPHGGHDVGDLLPRAPCRDWLSAPDDTPHPLPVRGEPLPPDIYCGHPEVEPLPLLLVVQVSGKELAHVAVASRRQIPVELAQLGAEAPGVRKGVGVSVSV
jgi:hypothetical protein